MRIEIAFTAIATLILFTGSIFAQEKQAPSAPQIKIIKATYKKLQLLQTELAKVSQTLTRDLPPTGKQKAHTRFMELRKEVIDLRSNLAGIIEKAKKAFPETPEVCRYYADLMVSRGFREIAQENLAITLAARPTDIQAGSLLAKLLFQNGHMLQSLETIKKLRQARGEKNILPILAIGLLGNLGRWGDAISEAETTLAALKALKTEQKETPFGKGKQIEQMIKQIIEHRSVCKEYEKAWEKELKLRKKENRAQTNPLVSIVTDRGRIELELFEDAAPNTVANFVELVQKKIYQGTAFHRDEPGFIIQGGDPNTKDSDPVNDGKGGPGYHIVDEFNYPGARIHFLGSLSMANNKGQPDTNGSQFFITKHTTHYLNGKHTVFGRVVKGMNVVFMLRKGDKIRKVSVIRKRDHKYEALKLK